jgi:hypothetical protein
MIGVLVFLELLAAARTILKHAPPVRDAIEERLIEILIDEIGHVSFQRLTMGRAGLALTRALCRSWGAACRAPSPSCGHSGPSLTRRSKPSPGSPVRDCPRRCDEARSSSDHEGR